jgi:dTDP-4-amino-4,6-dideoxygalactose transaminase
MNRYPLVDLAAGHRELGGELEAAVLEVIRSQQFIGGPRIATFESEFAAYLGASEVIGVANGTDALELAIRALEIEPGAEVLVPDNTFIATAEAVVAAGAVPRFVDCEPASGLIDLASCEERMSSRTRAVIPVHLYGRMVDMDAVQAFAARHSLAVIEDVAQAQGAQRGGRRSGTAGHVGCFSFYPGKNLGAFGDAGALATDDPRIADRVRLLRDHGRRGRTVHEVIGVNSRLDPIHAAVLTIKLAHLDDWNARRRQAAEWYRMALPPGIVDPELDVPEADVHHLLPIMLEDRDGVRERLTEAGVQTGIHYPVTVSDTPAFAHCAESSPAAERRAAMQLSLPMHPHLNEADVSFIAGVVAQSVSAQVL